MLRRFRKAHVPWLFPLAAVLAVFVALLVLWFPLIGHDYEIWFRYLLAGRWHFAHYGLAPLRYSVHLCGGWPIYGNPNDISYSVMQALALVTDPWRASIAALLLFLVCGYAGWYRLGRDVFKLKLPWAHVLSLIVIAHGFHLMHALVGHVNFFTMPLLGWLLWLLYSKAKPRFPLLLRTALFAVLSSVILHAAGYFTLIFFALLAALLLPCIAVFRRHVDAATPREIAVRCVLLAAGALLLSAGKLAAVWSLMQTFPRSTDLSVFEHSARTLPVVLRSLWWMPQHAGIFTGVPWGLHENSHFLSPVTLIGTVLGAKMLLVSLRDKFGRASVFAAIYVLALMFFCLELVRGYGPVAQWLHAVPPLQSMRVMMRLLYPFSLVVCIASVWALQQSTRRLAPQRQQMVAIAAMVITIFALPLGYYGVLNQLDLRPQPFAVLEQGEQARRAGFEHLRVTGVLDGDTNFLGYSGRECNGDALALSDRQRTLSQLVAGPTETVRDRRFNLVNPACYAYPDENGCRPGDRIAVEDADNFQAFISGGPLTWKVSELQRAADAVSLILLGVCALIIVWHAGRYRRSHSRP